MKKLILSISKKAIIQIQIILSLLLLVSTNVIAQYTITRDTSFNLGDTSAIRMFSNVALRSDGSVFLFTSSPTGKIYKVNPNGTSDQTFNCVIDNFNLENLFLSTNDEIYITSPTLIKRIDTTGAIDSTFNYLDSSISNVIDLVFQNDGKIIISIQDLNGISKVRRINHDGTIDTTFAEGSPTTGFITDLDLQSDGKCIVVGEFNNYQGPGSLKNVIRLNTNGVIDNTFNIGNSSPSGSNQLVVEVQNDGKILLGGGITLYSANFTTLGLVRFNNDGTLDTTFNSTEIGYYNFLKIKALANGKIMLVGDYSYFGNPIAYNGSAAIHRLLNDGSLDSTYNGYFEPSVNYLGIDAEIDSTGLTYWVCPLNVHFQFNDTTFENVISINETGFINTNFINGVNAINGTVYVCKQFQDGNIWAGGGFLGKGNIIRKSLIKLNSSGEIDTNFVSGTGFLNTKYAVMDIIELPNNKLIAAGGFEAYNDTAVSNIIQLHQNGLIDTSFYFANTQNTFAIHRVIKQPDFKILCLAEYFNSPIVDYDLLRLNIDGSIDQNWNTGTGFDFNCSNCHGIKKNSVQLDNNNKIVLGGDIITYNGQVVKKILRLNNDGSRDTTFAFDFGFDNTVDAIAIQPDNKIIVAGAFQNFNNDSVPSIVRLLENGILDTTFYFSLAPTLNNNYNKIEVLPNSKILVTFNTYSLWAPFKGILRLNSDGSIDTSFTMEIGFTDGAIFDFSLMLNGSSMLIGGSIKDFDNTEFNHLIKLKETQPSVVNTNEIALFERSYKIYPNPSNGVITIDFPNEQERKIEVSNAIGQLITTFYCNTNKTELTLDQQGIYFINVTDKTGNTQTKKVVTSK
jgi:uncharacterized delta-60 repeat protein